MTMYSNTAFVIVDYKCWLKQRSIVDDAGPLQLQTNETLYHCSISYTFVICEFAGMMQICNLWSGKVWEKNELS